MLEDTLVDLAPNRITEYVYELSNYFNTFYQACKVTFLILAVGVSVHKMVHCKYNKRCHVQQMITP